MGLTKKDLFCAGCCAFVMPLILFFSAYGASSVRSFSGAVSSSVAKNSTNGAVSTPRATSLPVSVTKSTSITTDGVKTLKPTAGQSSDSQRMPFSIHVSSTTVPTSTSDDIASAQQRSELIERTNELEERAGEVEERASDLEIRTDNLEIRADDLEILTDDLVDRADALTERATKVEERAGALETRADALETGLGKANKDITGLKEKDAGHDASIEAIYKALSGKEKTLQAGNYISLDDSGAKTIISATYKTGTAEESGLTRLYGTTGDAVNGTMTQGAIKTELDKLQTSISGVNDDLETGLGAANTEITNLKTTDAEHDEAIEAIRAALTGKEKTLKAGNYISIDDSGDKTVISATYSEGSNISIAKDGKISVSGVLPAQRLTGDNGSNGQLLQTNGNGVMTWVDAPSTSKVRNANGDALYDMWVDTGN